MNVNDLKEKVLKFNTSKNTPFYFKLNDSRSVTTQKILDKAKHSIECKERIRMDRVPHVS